MNDRILPRHSPALFAAWNNPFCAASARYLFWQSGRSLRAVTITAFHQSALVCSAVPIHTCRALGCLFPHQSISFLKDNSAAESSTSDIRVNPQDTKTRKEATGHFRWLPAIGQSLLCTGIMHSFDLATQTGTRDSLNGHWFQQYTRSVSELRGWSDSDRFYGPVCRASPGKFDLRIYRASE